MSTAASAGTPRHPPAGSTAGRATGVTEAASAAEETIIDSGRVGRQDASPNDDPRRPGAPGTRTGYHADQPGSAGAGPSTGLVGEHPQAREQPAEQVALPE